jgi:hypothetical protein
LTEKKIRWDAQNHRYSTLDRLLDTLEAQDDEETYRGLTVVAPQFLPGYDSLSMGPMARRANLRDFRFNSVVILLVEDREFWSRFL